MKNLKIKKTTWNLKLFFKGDNDPEMEKQRGIIKKESYKFINKWKDRDDYLEDPKILKEALDEYENWQRFYSVDGNEGLYFSLRIEQDQNNPKLKARVNKIQDFANKIWNDIRFFTFRLAKISKENQEKLLKSEDLKIYKHFLEKIFANSEYLLTEPEEKILSLKSTTAYVNWKKMTFKFLLKEEREVFTEKGKKEVKNFLEILSLTSSKKKKVRDSAIEAFDDILEEFSDLAEVEMNSVLKDKQINDDLRGFSRPDLFRHIIDDVDSSTVDILVETARSNFDISRKFYKLKAKLLKVDKLKYQERNIEYGNVDKNYSYEEAVGIVYQTLENIDKKFAEIFQGYVEKGQIDVFPKKGKKYGALCYGKLISQPSFLLVNFVGKIRDIITISHEVGHGIHNELRKGKQSNALNFNTAHFSAEIASTFMEDFVFEKILKEADDAEFRLSVMMMKLESDVSEIFRQISFYLFEKELHSEFRSKGYLSKEEIGKIFKKNMKEYMGNSVEFPSGSENGWVYVKNFRSFFYNYQYASGFLISKYFQETIKEDPSFIEKFKYFLSVGGSDCPKNIFSELGISIENEIFWKKGIKEVEDLLKETEKLAKKLGKI